jgi:uncharacterized protein
MTGMGIFIIQLICAGIWLKYFIYGPLEWLWRALTFMTFDIPFRREVIPAQKLTLDIVPAVTDKIMQNKN